MLPRMEITIDLLRRMAALGGYTWNDEELEAIRPAVDRALTLVEKLESLPLRDVEPSAQYRMF